MSKKKSLMFSFINMTKNPLGGKCPYGCVYCWSQSEKGLVNRYGMKKYNGEASLYPSVLKERFGKGDFVFVVDMRDPCSPDVTDGMLLTILDWIEKSIEARFLLLTKNPKRYLEIIKRGYKFPPNVVLGATIESNRNYPDISKAPSQVDRLCWMLKLSKIKSVKNDLFIAVEPILEFDSQAFSSILHQINPWMVAIGYDNYNWHLSEPNLDTVLKFIEVLEDFTEVEIKSLRPAWWAK